MSIRSHNESWPAGARSVAAVVLVLVAGAVAVGCGSPKSIHHYEPDVVAEQVREAQHQRSDLVLAIEDFSAGAAYDEQRMVYRSDTYRFDYYHFHRWAAPPGMLVADTLREVYRETGAFRSVVGGYDSRADVILSGRIVAFEEIDNQQDWLGRVVVNLQLRDARTGELLWNDTLERARPTPEKSPTGLAAAISEGLTDIGLSTTDTIVDVARKRPQKPVGGAEQSESEGGGMFQPSEEE